MLQEGHNQSVNAHEKVLLQQSVTMGGLHCRGGLITEVV